MQSLQSPCVEPLQPPNDSPAARLPLELVSEIVAAVGAPRCVRLAAVCSDWRAAVKCVLAEQNSYAWCKACAWRSPLLASFRCRLDDGSGALTYQSIHDKYEAAASSPLHARRLSIVADGPAADADGLLLGLELRKGQVDRSVVAPWCGARKVHGGYDVELASFDFTPFKCAADEIDDLRLTLFVARRDRDHDVGVLCLADGLAGDGEGDGWYVWELHAGDAGVANNARLNATLTFAGTSPPVFGKNRASGEWFLVTGVSLKLYVESDAPSHVRSECELRQVLEVLDCWH